jgi:hypothetical protein
MTTTNLLKARRKFKVAGLSIAPGDIVDLEALDLPPGRAQLLVDQRFGEYLTGGVATVPAPGSTPDATGAIVPVAGVTNSPAVPELVESSPEDSRVLFDGLLKAMKRSQLVDECVLRGLSSEGYRSDLIDRLLAESA